MMMIIIIVIIIIIILEYNIIEQVENPSLLRVVDQVDNKIRVGLTTGADGEISARYWSRRRNTGTNKRRAGGEPRDTVITVIIVIITIVVTILTMVTMIIVLSRWRPPRSYK